MDDADLLTGTHRSISGPAQRTLRAPQARSGRPADSHGQSATGASGHRTHAAVEDAGSLLEAAATAFAHGQSSEGRRLLRIAGTSPCTARESMVSGVLLATFASHASALRPDPTAHGEVAEQLTEWDQTLTAFSVLVAAEPDVSIKKLARSLASSKPHDCGLAAVVALHERDFTSALRLLQAASHEADERGEQGVSAHLRTLIGELSVQVGTHGTTQQLLTSAFELSEATAQPLWQARAATAWAIRSVLCEAPHYEREVRLAHRMALPASPALCDRAELLEAIVLSAKDRWTDAFHVLSRLARRQPQEITHLLPAGLLSLLADAATHSGHQVEARTLVSRVAAVDAHCECDIELAELLYASAVLSEGSAAQTCFEVALSTNPYRLPWHHARTSLAYGRWLRRSRRVTESRPHLLEALRTFQALDLPSWERRAQAELRASGLRAGDDSQRTQRRLDLSPQELEVAQLVARGLTNRQIGEALHLSPRTVGSHLYRIFPKLDVTSRSQLGALI